MAINLNSFFSNLSKSAGNTSSKAEKSLTSKSAQRKNKAVANKTKALPLSTFDKGVNGLNQANINSRKASSHKGNSTKNHTLSSSQIDKATKKVSNALGLGNFAQNIKSDNARQENNTYLEKHPEPTNQVKKYSGEEMPDPMTSESQKEEEEEEREQAQEEANKNRESSVDVQLYKDQPQGELDFIKNLVNEAYDNPEAGIDFSNVNQDLLDEVLNTHGIKFVDATGATYFPSLFDPEQAISDYGGNVKYISQTEAPKDVSDMSWTERSDYYNDKYRNDLVEAPDGSTTTFQDWFNQRINDSSNPWTYEQWMEWNNGIDPEGQWVGLATDENGNEYAQPWYSNAQTYAQMVDEYLDTFLDKDKPAMSLEEYETNIEPYLNDGLGVYISPTDLYDRGAIDRQAFLSLEADLLDLDRDKVISDYQHDYAWADPHDYVSMLRWDKQSSNQYSTVLDHELQNYIYSQEIDKNSLIYKLAKAGYDFNDQDNNLYFVSLPWQIQDAEAALRVKYDGDEARQEEEFQKKFGMTTDEADSLTDDDIIDMAMDRQNKIYSGVNTENSALNDTDIDIVNSDVALGNMGSKLYEHFPNLVSDIGTKVSGGDIIDWSDIDKRMEEMPEGYNLTYQALLDPSFRTETAARQLTDWNSQIRQSWADNNAEFAYAVGDKEESAQDMDQNNVEYVYILDSGVTIPQDDLSEENFNYMMDNPEWHGTGDDDYTVTTASGVTLQPQELEELISYVQDPATTESGSHAGVILGNGDLVTYADYAEAIAEGPYQTNKGALGIRNVDTSDMANLVGNIANGDVDWGATASEAVPYVSDLLAQSMPYTLPFIAGQVLGSAAKATPLGTVLRVGIPLATEIPEIIDRYHGYDTNSLDMASGAYRSNELTPYTTGHMLTDTAADLGDIGMEFLGGLFGAKGLTQGFLRDVGMEGLEEAPTGFLDEASNAYENGGDWSDIYRDQYRDPITGQIRYDVNTPIGQRVLSGAEDVGNNFLGGSLAGAAMSSIINSAEKGINTGRNAYRNYKANKFFNETNNATPETFNSAVVTESSDQELNDYING